MYKGNRSVRAKGAARVGTRAGPCWHLPMGGKWYILSLSVNNRYKEPWESLARRVGVQA